MAAVAAQRGVSGVEASAESHHPLGEQVVKQGLGFLQFEPEKIGHVVCGLGETEAEEPEREHVPLREIVHGAEG